MSERRSPRTLREHFRPLIPLVVAWSISAIVVVIAGSQRAVPVRTLFLDPADIAEVAWYTGLLSTLGVLGWTASSVVAAGAAWVASRTGRPTAARFLGLGAFATGLFLFDDLFQLHAEALPKIVGTPKPVNMAVVIAPTLLWAWTQRREIARTRHPVLAAAVGALAVSVLTDRFASESTTSLVMEDAAKLLGIVAWTLYFVLTARDIARSTIDAAMAATMPPADDTSERRVQV